MLRPVGERAHGAEQVPEGFARFRIPQTEVVQRPIQPADGLLEPVAEFVQPLAAGLDVRRARAERRAPRVRGSEIRVLPVGP